jgi:hypothetical protein
MSQGATGAFLSSPAAADLDGDGSIEIAVSAWDDSLWVLDAATGALRWGRRCDPKYSSPALGDLDGDGQLEVVMGSDRDTVYAWRANGAPLIPGNPTGAFAALPIERSSTTTPALADIDADPATVEVIYAAFKGDVYAWDGSGTLLWTCDVGPNRLTLHPRARGRRSRQGDRGGGDAGTCPPARPPTPSTSSTRRPAPSSARGPGPRQSPATCSAPATTSTRRASPTSTGTGPRDPARHVGLYLLQGVPRLGGATVLAFDPGGGGGGSPSPAPTPSRSRAQHDQRERENVNAQPVAADLDGGAGQWRPARRRSACSCSASAAAQDCTRGRLAAPAQARSTPRRRSATWTGTVASTCSCARDGEVRIFDLGTAHVAGAIEWGQFLHDPRHTSNYATPMPSGGSLPQPGPAAPARLALAQNAPNPFRPPTRIAYELAARGRVRLEIFAVDGRFVRALVDRVEEPGPHEAAWDGRDARGVELPAGIYFCRLEAQGRSAARKLLLVK